jgi:hypothetical protein
MCLCQVPIEGLPVLGSAFTLRSISGSPDTWGAGRSAEPPDVSRTCDQEGKQKINLNALLTPLFVGKPCFGRKKDKCQLTTILL